MKNRVVRETLPQAQTLMILWLIMSACPLMIFKFAFYMSLLFLYFYNFTCMVIFKFSFFVLYQFLHHTFCPFHISVIYVDSLLLIMLLTIFCQSH